jgi:hypothetical protein
VSAIIEEKHRYVIPRWRDFSVTAELGELDSLRDAKRIFSEDSFFQEKIRDWETFKTASFAADLVGAAFVFGRYNEGAGAARFLLTQRDNVPEPAIQLALKLLKATNIGESSFIHDLVSEEPVDKLRKDIGSFRKRLRDEPRNALLWTEMARVQIILGFGEPAERAMRIALALAPTSRFVLRSATRLKLHLKKLTEAHDLLRRNIATQTDPWLMASEIAVSAIINRTSRYIKLGKTAIHSKNYSPYHTSELASALATLELVSGNTHNARKLFRIALDKPNENAVAQAEWASKNIKDLEVSAVESQVPRTFEAKARRNFQSADWNKSYAESWNWLLDQPFSSRPAAFGSYIAGVYLENYDACEKMATIGLISNPNDYTLLNNIAFACACRNQTDKATAILTKINKEQLTQHERICCTATQGLVHFRTGEMQLGRQHYLEAINLAKGPDHFSLKVLAAFFLVREEMKANTTESLDLNEQLIKELKPLNRPEFVALREKLILQKRTLPSSNQIYFHNKQSFGLISDSTTT